MSFMSYYFLLNLLNIEKDIHVPVSGLHMEMDIVNIYNCINSSRSFYGAEKND